MSIRSLLLSPALLFCWGPPGVGLLGMLTKSRRPAGGLTCKLRSWRSTIVTISFTKGIRVVPLPSVSCTFRISCVPATPKYDKITSFNGTKGGCFRKGLPMTRAQARQQASQQSCDNLLCNKVRQQAASTGNPAAHKVPSRSGF